MKFKLGNVLVVAVFLLSFNNLFAQANQTKANITPAHFKAAEEVLLASGADKEFKTSLKAVVDQYGEQVPLEKRDKFKQVLNDFLAKYADWESVKDNLTSMYAEAFTEAELKQLAAFYRTPLGKKVIEEQPLLLQKSVQLGQTLIASHQIELQQQLQEVFKEK